MWRKGKEHTTGCVKDDAWVDEKTVSICLFLTDPHPTSKKLKVDKDNHREQIDQKLLDSTASNGVSLTMHQSDDELTYIMWMDCYYKLTSHLVGGFL